RVLVEELGLEPGPALQDLQRRILAHEAGPARPLQETTVTPLRAPSGGGEARKTVTVVAGDLVETSTGARRTDAEVFRRVHKRALERAADVLARHGGTVERFVGDAFAAVFGVPIAHEDDTLRAARAAVELRTELEALNVELEAEWGVTLAV